MTEMLPRIIFVLVILVLMAGLIKSTHNPLANFNFSTGLVEKQ
jgi:hypothetical protein